MSTLLLSCCCNPAQHHMQQTATLSTVNKSLSSLSVSSFLCMKTSNMQHPQKQNANIPPNLYLFIFIQRKLLIGPNRPNLLESKTNMISVFGYNPKSREREGRD
ncbi:hypothetical protein XENOCAPTIV_019321 [Xenoophorus captivus]|uniref:Uncharacterized protein n=1 Tax=Xenoophorus captivus TaxID=1517983 RepID=A0ABV0RI34_9TELE